MIYAYDQHMQMPVRDLYDTQMMAIAINAAKDMYEKGQKQIDDFYEKYSDFTTPIEKDMQTYNNVVINPMREGLDYLYRNGIDPVRSAEGRAYLARLSRNVPMGLVSQLRESAKVGDLYLKAMAEQKANGTYNPDADSFFNPIGLGSWDTAKMGVWTNPSPSTVRSLHDATYNWMKDRTPHSLTKDEVEQSWRDAGLTDQQFDPAYDYTGWTYNDLRRTVGQNTPGWMGTMEGRFYYDQARKQLIREGNVAPTAKEIQDRLEYNVAEAQRSWLVQPVKSENKYKLAAFESNLAYDKWKRQHNYELAHPKATSSSSSGGGSGKNNKGEYNYLMKATEENFVKNNGVNHADVQRTAAVNATNMAGYISPSAFINNLAQTDPSDSSAEVWLGRQQSDKQRGVFLYNPAADSGRMYTAEELKLKAVGVYDDSDTYTRSMNPKSDATRSGNGFRNSMAEASTGDDPTAILTYTKRLVPVLEEDNLIHWYQEYQASYRRDGKTNKQLLYYDMNSPFTTTGVPVGGNEYEFNNELVSKKIATGSNATVPMSPIAIK